MTTAPLPRATLSELVARASEGQQHAVARLLTKVERSLADAAEVLGCVSDLPRGGTVVGFVGSPGVGKSSLVATVTSFLAARPERVAVIANDPTGFTSGGALLGDRVRMKSLARDPNVFIRSAAARDPLRSLGASTHVAVEVLARLGFDHVIVEAVGAGQSDIGTRHVADTSVLVLSPGIGDDVQAMKSGLMELADVFAVNKSDLPGARETLRMLRQSVTVFEHPADWRPPVLPVSATAETGIAELVAKIEEHNGHISLAPEKLTTELIVDLVVYEVARRIRNELPSSRRVTAGLNGHGGEFNVVEQALQIAEEILPAGSAFAPTTDQSGDEGLHLVSKRP
jgi:LAO/AO transport system kinase